MRVLLAVLALLAALLVLPPLVYSLVPETPPELADAIQAFATR